MAEGRSAASKACLQAPPPLPFPMLPLSSLRSLIFLFQFFPHCGAILYLMCVQFSCIWLSFVHKIMLCWYYKPWNYKPLSKLELKKKPIFYLWLTKYCFSSVDSEMLCCHSHIDMLRQNPLENWVISIFSGQFPMDSVLNYLQLLN